MPSNSYTIALGCIPEKIQRGARGGERDGGHGDFPNLQQPLYLLDSSYTSIMQVFIHCCLYLPTYEQIEILWLAIICMVMVKECIYLDMTLVLPNPALLVGESQDLFYTLLICQHALIFWKPLVKFNHGIKGSLAIGGQCGLFHFLSGQHSCRGFGVISKYK